MAEPAGDRYTTPAGTTTVANPVQRRILAALAQGEKQLPELVEITGKAKPALSGTHMKELLALGLVEETPHPTDSRRKIFRLAAKPEADGRTTAASPTAPHGGASLPLAQVFQALAAAPAKASETVLRRQAEAIGAAWAPRFPPAAWNSAHDFAMTLASFVEVEKLAHHLQIDFEALSFRCRPGEAVASVSPGRLGLLLAAFAQGAAQAGGLGPVGFEAAADGEAFRLRPTD
ncbi:MAG: winged helix-turn-helix domain-containing protein [Thermoplasmatota archaeon]